MVTPGAVSFSNVVAADVVSSTASIVSPAYSTSHHLDAGSYYQTASGLSGVDAGNYSLAGGFTTSTQNYTVGQLALNVTGLTGTSRVYNGSTVDALHGIDCAHKRRCRSSERHRQRIICKRECRHGRTGNRYRLQPDRLRRRQLSACGTDRADWQHYPARQRRMGGRDDR
jgi:hypothetical protein